MNKRTAITLARAGVTAGRLRAILNAAQFDGDEPSSVNANFTKQYVKDNYELSPQWPDNHIVDYWLAVVILREFAEEPNA